MKKLTQFKSLCNNNVDISPFMNLVVVLIPILLVAAEFSRISIIEIDLPKEATSCGTSTTIPREKPQRLELRTIVTDSTITIGSSNTILPSYYYTTTYKNSNTKSSLTTTNRNYSDIALLATTSDNKPIEGYYTKDNNLLFNTDGSVCKQIEVNKEVLINSQRIMVSSKLRSSLTHQQVSVLDLIENTLQSIRERFHYIEDSDVITIAAEDKIIYDKLIQLMDTAKKASFKSVQISKLRS